MSLSILGRLLGLRGRNTGLYLCFNPSSEADLSPVLAQVLFLLRASVSQSSIQWDACFRVCFGATTVSQRGQGASPSLDFGLPSFKTQLPGAGVAVIPALLAIWPPRSSLTMWPPFKQLLQRLKASLLRSSYKSLDPLLSTLPANRGPNGCVQACAHAQPPRPPADLWTSHHHLLAKDSGQGGAVRTWEASPGARHRVSG